MFDSLISTQLLHKSESYGEYCAGSTRIGDMRLECSKSSTGVAFVITLNVMVALTFSTELICGLESYLLALYFVLFSSS